MGIASQFIKELEGGGLDTQGALRFLQENETQFSSDERVRAQALIAQIDARALLESPRKATLRSLIPAGWLRDYMALSDISEAPESFHFFSAVSALTHIIGKRISYPIGLGEITAPTSVFLLSPAGRATRSTAAIAAIQVAKQGGSVVLSGKFTPEGLIRWIEKDRKTMIFTDEAAEILSKRDYMSEMPVTLCKILDGGNCDVTLSQKQVRIPECTANLLIACAPDWLLTAFPKASLGGGLMSRVLMVYEEKKSKLLPRPNDTGISREAVLGMQAELAKRLRDLDENLGAGRLMFSADAGKRYDAFYFENDKALAAADERLAVYLSRKPAHVLRMLMALVASSGADRTITEEQVEIALAILMTIELGIEKAYKEAGLEKDSADHSRVLKLLDKFSGRIDRSVLINKTGWNKRHLDEVLETLQQSGRITQPLFRPGAGGKKLVTYYEKIEE